MSQMALPKVAAPTALHRAESDLPFVTFFEGLDFQLLQASVENGLWVVRTRFQPGVTIPTHRHTGEVFAVTFRGSWRYLEYPDLNTAGSYLFEPAGSQHTLHVPASNTEITDVWFAIRGANLNLDEHGNVASVLGCDVHDRDLPRAVREGGIRTTGGDRALVDPNLPGDSPPAPGRGFLAQCWQAPTAQVHPDGSRPSLNIEHSARQSNSVMLPLQSNLSFAVGCSFGKQQHPGRASAFSHDSPIQPPFIGPASCAFEASTAFFQSAILAKVGAAGRMARHSVWVFSPQT